MSNERQRPTSIDYVLTGLASGLIMGMICCLIFFLITIVYRGEFALRLMYVLGLFTFASVLIARIAIEQSRADSLKYILFLGVATLLVVSRYMQFPDGLQFLGLLITVGFLVLIVVLSDRITFDCTVINDKADSSGEGLLQSLGLIHSTLAADRKVTSKVAVSPESDMPKKRKHNPGVWVLYFALLALPLFGIGQLTIPASEAVARSRAFWFLFGYLLCALSLLVTTSFLGMRRYLRQRNVPMPADMAFTWLAFGSGGVLLILLVACLLPLPGRQFGLFGMPFTINSSDLLLSSRFGWGSEGTDKQTDSSRRVSKRDGNNAAGGETRTDGTQPGGEVRPDGTRAIDSEGKSSTQGQSGKASSSGRNNSSTQQQSKGDSPSDSQANPSDPNRKTVNGSDKNTGKTPLKPTKMNFRFPSGLDAILKLITIFVLLGLIVAYFVIYWREVLSGLRMIAAWWANLWGGQGTNKNSVDASASDKNRTIHYLPFASFPNPFGNQLNGWSLDKVVRHTFSAVEAWGREHTLQRSDQETPEEYLRRLSQSYPDQQEEFQRLGSLYNRLAYARGNLDGRQVNSLSNLWSWLRRA